MKAKDDQSLNDVPVDAFRVEYYGQGDLAKVAEDPLKHPERFQEFLDRHTSLRDLLEPEEHLVTNLRENAGRLSPLESAFGQLTAKRQSLQEIETKLKIAEEGNLREVVGTQSKLASEKAIRESIETIATEYSTGFNFSNIQRDFDQILTTAGTCTEDEESKKALAAIKDALNKNNAAVKKMEIELNLSLKSCARELSSLARELRISHQRMSAEVAIKLADLRSRGIATDMPGLELLLRQKTSAAKEIATIEQRSGERNQCLEQRKKLRAELAEIREKMTARRKEQLKGINANLGETIKDYTIFVKYDEAGITAEFESFIQEKMQGTYLQDNLIADLCSRITPSRLADLVLERQHGQLATETKISKEWAEKIIDKLCYWEILFRLQVLAKQPKPTITVRTKSTPPREIPVLQLSDGQRHTILLTIAMLAESNVPLLVAA